MTSFDESHIASALLNENCLHFDQEFYRDSEYGSVWAPPTIACNEKAESESRNVLEFKSSCSGDNRCQVGSFSKMVKDKLLMVDQKNNYLFLTRCC